jgi:hypothetical protein
MTQSHFLLGGGRGDRGGSGGGLGGIRINGEGERGGGGDGAGEVGGGDSRSGIVRSLIFYSRRPESFPLVYE